MSRVLVTAIVFVGGVGVGLLIAKYYAQYKVQSSIDSGLSKIGLGGGTVQSIVDGTVVPILVG